MDSLKVAPVGIVHVGRLSGYLLACAGLAAESLWLNRRVLCRQSE